MKKDFIVSMVLITILAITPLTVFAEQYAPSIGLPLAYPAAIANDIQNNIAKQIIVKREKPETDDLYYDNAYDSFLLEYIPLGDSLSSETVCTVFIFTHNKWKKVKDDKNYSENYAVLKTTENFVFVIYKNKYNPYIEESKDYEIFNFYAGQASSLINAFNLGEIKASVIFGTEMNYYFRLPSLKDVAAIRNVPDNGALQKETIDFLYMSSPDYKIATLYVYNKADWQSLKKEKQTPIGNVILDFMDYIFVLSPAQPNPYIEFSPDATGFEAAYNSIKQSASKAYIYNFNGVTSPINKSKDQEYSNLIIGGRIVSDKIIFDADNRPLFPMRILSEALGCKVEWDSENSAFTIIKGDSLVASKIVESSFSLENYAKAGQISCAIIDGTTYIDTGFAVNVLNCALSLDTALQGIAVQSRR